MHFSIAAAMFPIHDLKQTCYSSMTLSGEIYNLSQLYNMMIEKRYWMVQKLNAAQGIITLPACHFNRTECGH